MNWLKQAVTAEDNKTYEGAYLALAAIIALVMLTIVCMLVLAGIEIWLCDRKLQKECFNPAGLGGGIAAAIAAVGAFLAGVGSYILMDRKQQFPPVSTTTTTDTTTVKTVAAASEAGAGLVIEPLSSPKIGPEDAGARVALLKKKQNGKKGR